MDEHRLGLKPVLRRVWAPRGGPVVAPVRPRYKWLYVWAFLRPATGETFWLLPPTVSVEACTLARREFARAVGAGDRRRVALVWDGAGWHASKRVRVPAGVHPIRLPADSPEVQPAERLWPLVDEAVANRVPADLAELEELLAERCRWLDARPAAVKPLTAFHWWPDHGPT
jgi:hypothetical protein